MSYNYWGFDTWRFLHTMSEKIKEENYETEKVKILSIIKSICNTLPCPDCKSHAVTFMKKITIKNIPNKQNLQILLLNFHNEVNKRLKKEIQSNEILETYKSNNLIEIIHTFVKVYSRPVHNNRLMMDSLNRNFLMKEILKYFNSNIDKFDK